MFLHFVSVRTSRRRDVWVSPGEIGTNRVCLVSVKMYISNYPVGLDVLFCYLYCVVEKLSSVGATLMRWLVKAFAGRL